MSGFNTEFEIFEDDNFEMEAPKDFRSDDWQSKSGRPGKVLFSKYFSDYISSECYITVSTVARNPITSEVRRRVETHIGEKGFDFEFTKYNGKNAVFYCYEEEVDYKTYHAFIVLSDKKAVLLDIVFNQPFDNTREVSQGIFKSFKSKYSIEVTEQELELDAARLDAEAHELESREAAKKAVMEEERRQLEAEQARYEQELLMAEQARREQELLMEEQARREREALEAAERERREREALEAERARREQELLMEEQARREREALEAAEREKREREALEAERAKREQELLMEEQARREREALEAAEREKREREALEAEQARHEQQFVKAYDSDLINEEKEIDFENITIQNRKEESDFEAVMNETSGSDEIEEIAVSSEIQEEEPQFDDTEDGKRMHAIYDAIKANRKMTVNSLLSMGELRELGRMDANQILSKMVRQELIERLEEDDKIYFVKAGFAQQAQGNFNGMSGEDSEMSEMERYKKEYEVYKVRLAQWKKSRDIWGRTELPKPVEPVKPKRHK